MNWRLGLVAVLILAMLGAIGWWWWNHTHGLGSDCLILAHEKTSGIDFSFTVDKVKSLQATLGLTDKDVRDFDDILKDYGAKYETICKDYSGLHVITAAEYNCRRDNMDKTLDSIRALREVLGKTSGDAANTTAKKSIESILNAAHGSFKSGCGASLRINPDKIRISKEINHVITALNVGNRDISFGVVGVPQCLLPEPRAGELKQGGSVDIMLWRTYYPVSSDSFTFTIDDNFDNHIPVEVSGATNLPSPDALAADLRSRVGHTPTLEDALVFLNVNNQKPSAGTFVTAAAVLSSAGNSGDAVRAIQMAESMDPQVKNEASIQLESGILHLTNGDSNGALVRLRVAESASDWRIANTSRYFSGITLIKSGKMKEAASYICGEQGPADPDPGIMTPVALKYGFAIHDLERARTSKDCAASVARVKPDLQMPDRRDEGTTEEGPRAYEKMDKMAKYDRWEGIVIRISPDKSTMTVRASGSNVERAIQYDSSTRWISQEHGSKRVADMDASQIKNNDRVIAMGTWDKDGVLHANVISKRLTK